MDDKTFDAAVARIDRVIADLKAAIDLRVTLEVAYMRERCDADQGADTVLMEIHPNYQYASATLIVYVGACLHRSDDDLAEKILHEFAHYFVHPMSQYDKSPEHAFMEERVCTDIALVIKNAMQAAADEVGDHWKKKYQQLEKEHKKVLKEKVA